jgi:hypothetical protein
MLCAKLRRAVVNPEREPLGGVVEADETIVRFRTKNDLVVMPPGCRRSRQDAGRRRGRSRRRQAPGARLKVIESFSK